MVKVESEREFTKTRSEIGERRSDLRRRELRLEKWFHGVERLQWKTKGGSSHENS